MKNYAGFDVSLKETFICIMDEQGNVLHEGQTDTHPESIKQYLDRMDFQLEKAAIESGSLSHWLVSELQALGVPTICVDARHMSSMLSMKINKTDSNDARGIADALRGGYVREVSLKSQNLVDMGILLQSRAILVQERTKLKNAVRGLLKGYGIKITSTGNSSFVRIVREIIEDKNPSVKEGLDALLNILESLEAQITILNKEIEKIGKDNKDAQLLMTIPGVGILTALAFLVALGDYRRFHKSRNVAAYLGLTPRQYSSGEVQRFGRISKCGSRQTRSLLVEAATVMMTRTRSWCKPKAWAMKLQKKKGFKKAAVALGRKLAVIMHRMLIKQEEFCFGDFDKESRPKEKVA